MDEACKDPSIAGSRGSPTPVSPSQRIEALDVLRGIALLGILLLNILAFGLPGEAYFSPAVDGALSGVNFAAFATVEVCFEGVMRALFSMLFGAGVVMLAEGRGAGPYYRRQVLLLGFGLLNAFALLFSGDILVTYALAGLVLYPVRSWPPRRLLIAAGLVFVWLGIVYGSLFAAVGSPPSHAVGATAAAGTGAPSSPDRHAALTLRQEVERYLEPSREDLERDALAHTAPYPIAFAANAENVVETWTGAMPWTMFWDALGCMLLGMALYRAGWLQAKRPDRDYAVLVACGLVVGLGVNGTELAMRLATDLGMQWTPAITTPTYDIGRVATALGYLALVMLACRRGLVPRLRHALAPVGRMALTNYLMQSAICLIVFHGLGFGLWNRLDRAELYLVVAAIWAFQIAFSRWWLRRHRFGPAEWLWRALTYGRLPVWRSGA